MAKTKMVENVFRTLVRAVTESPMISVSILAAADILLWIICLIRGRTVVSVNYIGESNTL
jgi:hypothetical protein